jgi:hypothetical protein
MGNSAYKILSDIILGKIKPYIGKVMWDYQNGFRDGRSVIDNIYALKIINEKLWEYNRSVCLLFVFLALQPFVVLFYTALQRALASSFSRFLDHTQRCATVGRTHLDE